MSFHETPSKCQDHYWIFATNIETNYPDPTMRNGKWLIFIHVTEIDETWELIKIALNEGLLGKTAKVSTIKQNPNVKDKDTKVICVYTYDSDDEDDVMRIRNEIRKLGFVKKLPYKTDHATVSGKYEVRGHVKISKYYV